MGVIIHIHRVLIDRAPHKGPRNVVIEDEVVVADEVERRWAIAGNQTEQSKFLKTTKWRLTPTNSSLTALSDSTPSFFRPNIRSFPSAPTFT